MHADVGLALPLRNRAGTLERRSCLMGNLSLYGSVASRVIIGVLDPMHSAEDDAPVLHANIGRDACIAHASYARSVEGRTLPSSGRRAAHPNAAG